MSAKNFHRFASLLIALTLAVGGFSPALAAPPSNDNFVDAKVVTSLPFSDAVDISEAGVETGEPSSCFATDRTAWYTFTPSETVTVRITKGGTTVFSNISVFRATGTTIADLELIGCPLYNPAPMILEAGQQYYIQAGAYPGEDGTIEVYIRQAFPPSNDKFVDAEEVTSLPFSSTVDVSDAWIEDGEFRYCSLDGLTVWYKFTPAEDTLIQTDSLGSSIGSQVTIYEANGFTINDLNFMACAAWGQSFNFLAEAGQTYYFQVGRTVYGEYGAIKFNLRHIFPPANDNFADSDVISSLPFRTTVDNTDATTEPGEQQWCYFMDRTVWYSFTPDQTMLVEAGTKGSLVTANLNIYRATGPGISDLQVLTCTIINSPRFIAEAGQTYYIQAGSVFGEVGNIQFTLEQIPPPANDDFANAKVVPSPLPFNDTVDTQASSRLSGEPTPSCAYNGPGTRSVWYAFTPATNGSISASIPWSAFTPVFAVYTGNTLADLTQTGCQTYTGNLLTFHVNAGTTYYFQVGNLYPWEQGGSMQFHLDAAPQPVVGFYFYPSDPSIYDTIQFFDGSYDPGQVDLQSFTWDFGDGATATGSSPTHKYAQDGDYTVQHSVTTIDGRTASMTQVVQVRTHDVGITKISAPQSANANQTRTITVSVNSKNHAETVQIDLYKSVAGGFEYIGSITQQVPARSSNRTTAFHFNYTFTTSDAGIEKVTFKAIAVIVGARDSYPSDNEAISSPPTRVPR